MRVQRTARACPDEGAIFPAAAVASSPEHEHARLLEYYGRLVGEADAEFPPVVEAPPPGAARRARRVARQRADQLVRVLSAACRASAALAHTSTGVAA